MKQPKSPGPKNNQNKSDQNEEGYPSYPKDDDIYTRFKEEQDIDPENPSQLKEDELPELLDVEAELDDTIMGSDLDIPGAELDDENEDIGNEDEENNYYSLGGDKHHDLEEDQGEEWP